MKWTCSVCGYTYEGPEPPAKCPQCGVPADKFVEVKEGEIEFVDEHVVGVAQGVDPEIIQGLKDNFNGECSEVGMYLAMARVAHREGYPEIGLYWEKAAWEEAEHAAKFAELLGEVVTDSTKKNLEMRVEAEAGACAGKKALAKLAKDQNLERDPRYCSRNGKRRSKTRQGICWSAEEIFRLNRIENPQKWAII